MSSQTSASGYISGGKIISQTIIPLGKQNTHSFLFINKLNNKLNSVLVYQRQERQFRRD